MKLYRFSVLLLLGGIAIKTSASNDFDVFCIFVIVVLACISIFLRQEREEGE